MRKGKEKFTAIGGPFSGSMLWLSGDTLEFTITKRIPKSYLNKHERVDHWRGYYTCKPYQYSKHPECNWVDTTPKQEPNFQFESRENINGFSNGL